MSTKYPFFNKEIAFTNKDYMDCFLKDQHFDPSLTDDSTYSPSSEVVKQASINKLVTGRASAEGVFDSQAGDMISAPKSIPISREKGVDRAELSQAILAQQSDINRQAKRRKDEIKSQEASKKAADSLAKIIKSSSAQSAEG